MVELFTTDGQFDLSSSWSLYWDNTDEVNTIAESIYVERALDAMAFNTTTFLIVWGDPGYDTNKGAIWLLFYKFTAIDSYDIDLVQVVKKIGTEFNLGGSSQFGTSITHAAINNDDIWDLMVSAPSADKIILIFFDTFGSITGYNHIVYIYFLILYLMVLILV